LHNVDVFQWVPIFSLKSLVGELLLRLPVFRISVPPLSEEWCLQHQRDMEKRLE
jgi:hypothetical protein